MLQRGMDFFRRYGGASVFIGRFFGPLRAVIPIAAGMMRMPTALFYVANIVSAVVWAPVLLLSGALIARSVVSSNHADAALLAIAAAAMAMVAIVYWARRRMREG